MPTQQSPYGSWPSPIDATALVSGASNPTDIWAEQGITWWSQTRPDQGGRIQVMRRDPDGTVRDALPDGWNARTRVHEYGGGAWWVHDGTVFTASWTDQRLYRVDPGRAPVALTPQPAVPHGLRYSDGRLTPDGTTVICVREDHTRGTEDGTGDGAGPVPPSAVRNEIVALAARSGGGDPAPPAVLVTGHDFVAAPRISPDGRSLAWISWEHPDMPWDRTTLWVADLITDGASTRLERRRRVAGSGPDGAGGISTGADSTGADSGSDTGGDTQSLLQPEWSPAGGLFVISDRNDWWNVYRVTDLDGSDAAGSVVAVHPVEAEVGRPAWGFGQSRYVVDAEGTVRFTYSDGDGAHLVTVREKAGVRDDVLPFTALTALRRDDGPDGARLVALASSADTEPAVLEFPLDPRPETTASGPSRASAPALRHLRPPRDPATTFGLGAEAISRPRRIAFPSGGNRTAHAWLYLPASALVEAPAQERPPLLVTVHGGPTASADPSFRLDVQFWTSRGFAVADVDYGGSTGHGRAYRRLLDGAWGVVDVEDVCAAARWLADQGLVDGDRMAIRGSSAGGYTTLLALATTQVFAAGASYYGVADLRALTRDTHKFESRYLDRLVGPWPQAEAVYAQRSPLERADGFSRPLIVLQGAEDAVVPPAQAELIVSALAARQVPHAYLLFAGEQHGFRTAETIVTARLAELSFYGQVFGFAPAGEVPRLTIEFADRLPAR